MRDGSSLGSAMAGVSSVVSAIHGFGDIGNVSPASVDRDGNRHLIDLAARANATVVLMSIVGASAEHPIELFRMKYAAEEHLRASGVPWTIVRATAFAEFWLDLLTRPQAPRVARSSSVEASTLLILYRSPMSRRSSSGQS